MIKYKLFKIGGDYTLDQDDTEMYCPYTRGPARCGSWCPLFELSESRPRYFVRLLCSPHIRSFEFGGVEDGGKDGK